MTTLTKLLLIPAVVVAFGVGIAIAATAGGDEDPAPPAMPAGSTTTTGTTTEDGTTTTDTTTTTGTTTGPDVSGPCDEAEHANDPRCTGGADRDRDDDRDGRHGGGEDRSGPNRGPGDDDS